MYKNEILTPQSYFFHTFKMSPIADSTIPIIKSTETSLEDQIKNAVVDSKYEKMRELKTYKGQLEVLASRLDHIYQTLASNLLPS